jgi:hypothetical protein
MAANQPYVPFSQREGFDPVPPQLKLGEVSAELRRQLDYYVGLEVGRGTRHGYSGSYFGEKWDRVAKDFHVLVLKQRAGAYENNPSRFKRSTEDFIRTNKIEKLFDFVEFFIRYPGCSNELKRELAEAFVSARAAYRIVDNQIVAIGTEQQAEAYETAIAAAEAEGGSAARQHLVAAGSALRAGNWAGSVRESIHAVEAMALRLAPGKKTLGPALSELQRDGH